MTTSTNLLITHLDANVAAPQVVLNAGTDLIDTAVAGMLTHNMASDADYTLSVLTSPKEWQYATIKITDTGVVLTASRNIIVPTNTKHYTLINSTAQEITLKTSGGTGVAVAAGEQAALLCDGTNVISQVSSAGGGGGGGGGALEVSPEIVTADKTLTAANGHYQLIEAATTAVITITLPDATTLDESGLSYLISNRSKLPLQIKDNGGNKVFFIPEQSSSIIALEDNSTAAGTWGEITDNATGLEVIGSAVAETVATLDAITSCQINEEYAFTAYTRSSTHLYGYISQLNSSDVVSVGSVVAINAAASFRPRCVALSLSAVLVVYQGTSGYLYARVLNISGTSITFVNAEQTLVSTSVASQGFDLFFISSTQAALMYEDPTSTNDLSVCVLSISGATVTKNTNGVIDTNAVTYEEAVMLNSSKLLTIYMRGADQYYSVVNFSGTTATPETPVEITEYSASNTFIPARKGLLKLSETKAVLVGYSDGFVSARIFYIDGNTVTGGNTKQLNELSTIFVTGYFSACEINDSKIALQGFRSGGGYFLGTITILGDAITKYEPALVSDVFGSNEVTDIVYLKPYDNATDHHGRLLSMRAEGSDLTTEGYILHKQSVKF